MKESVRKPLGMLLLVIGIAAYCLAAGLLLSMMSRPHIILEVLAYMVAGIAWIWLARPVLVWIQTGHWRAGGENKG